MTIILIILSPLLVAVFSLCVRRNTKLLEVFTITSAAVELVAGLIIAYIVHQNGSYSFTSFFTVDALGIILVMIITVVGFAASWYSISYVREEVKEHIIGFRRIKQYYIFLNLFIFAMLSAVVTTSPIIMWVSIEGTTLSTAFLVSFYNKPAAIEAAWKYLIINSVGLLLGFFGTLLFFAPTVGVTDHHGVIHWQTILSNPLGSNPFVTKIAFIFVLIGYGTKMGLVPMHTWLPDAHSNAPVPISSLLSGVLLSVAFYAILHFKAIVDSSIGADFSQTLLIVFGSASVLVASFFILIQKDYKRLFAYSSIEHMGIMALGFGFGGIGAFAAILHMIYHSLAKSILFFSAGNIFLKFRSTQIANIRGTLSVLPITGIILLIGFLTITGVPPFGIFITKLYLLTAGIKEHPFVTAIMLFSFALVFAGFLRHVVSMVFGKSEGSTPKSEISIGTILPSIVLVFILIILGLYLPSSIKLLIETAAANY